jgi:hypothetical protein
MGGRDKPTTKNSQANPHAKNGRVLQQNPGWCGLNADIDLWAVFDPKQAMSALNNSCSGRVSLASITKKISALGANRDDARREPKVQSRLLA